MCRNSNCRRHGISKHAYSVPGMLNEHVLKNHSDKPEEAKRQSVTNSHIPWIYYEVGIIHKLKIKRTATKFMGRPWRNWISSWNIIIWAVDFL